MERTKTSALASVDPIWHDIRTEAEAMVRAEPEMAGLAFACILNEDRLEHAIAQRIVQRLDHTELPGQLIRQAFDDFLDDRPEVAEIMRVDLAAVYDRDPACARKIEPVLYFKGFQAIQTQRLGNWLWNRGRRDFALYLQSRSSIIYGVDIHPAVPLGRGVFIDHATGVVVGMTAVIEDDVSILQEVTLGGTGKERGDRHPKIRRGVLIGAGAKILGNIEIGACSRVAAGSVVLHEVPPGVTVAGVPARVVGRSGCNEPSRAMDQILAETGRDA